jgi:adenine-specific DNA glycosylase
MVDIVPEHGMEKSRFGRAAPVVRPHVAGLSSRRLGFTAWQVPVNEFMLRQALVARVEPIWRDWVARWPTPSSTTAASAADVLRAWGKLGYPRA